MWKVFQSSVILTWLVHVHMKSAALFPANSEVRLLSSRWRLKLLPTSFPGPSLLSKWRAEKTQPRPQGALRFQNGGRLGPWRRAGHVSPKILEILIIQNGGKVAAVEQTSPRRPRHERKMADKTDMSLVQTTIQEFLSTFARGRWYDIGWFSLIYSLHTFHGTFVSMSRIIFYHCFIRINYRKL